MPSFILLPSDLLLQIFAILIDLDDSSPETLEPVVLRLSSLCKSLRDIVVNSPTLWSRIRLRNSQDLSGVRLFLERSATCLLDVSIFSDVFVELALPGIIQNYSVARWRTLTLRAPVSSQITRFLQAISNFPTPELLHVQLLPHDYEYCGERHTPILSNASETLRTLTMYGCLSCLPPLPHLTTVNLFRFHCNYEELHALIQGSPNLTTLILGALMDLELYEAMASRPWIEATALRFLAVGFTNTHLNPSYKQPLLSLLSAPNLEFLEVNGTRADCGDFSWKSFPELHVLCLRNMHCEKTDAAVYRSFTKITRVELTNVGGIKSLLAPEEGGGMLWPNLQTLVCWPVYEDLSYLRLMDGRPRLTLVVPEQRRDNPDVLEMASRGTHCVRFCSEKPAGLIRPEDFARTEWEDDEEDWSDEDVSDFSGEDLEYDLDYEYEFNGMEEADYSFDDDDEGLEGVEGWY
ncbi:hypothetical protein GGX14DRAFT_556347 [Mycena pura]|uniref:F-box domain-containing protein n=1 Tax=Mycena pura TaxID=153505 RepID=A0AAD7E2S7_9AGAR|nr:hypothetical protein GGX14DRAFT_556347 [Mycena pura]